ncbi:MAG: lipid-A-disaccharide synthase [Gammaproteobacteria bacterium]|nr:lipid-A-disaccharide synthase [Gammaproteobacteria bacterium]
MISAGEASGDAHAAHALAALQERLPEVTSFGMGAEHLQSTGTELIVDSRDLAVIGFVDVLLNYHKFLQRLKKLRTAMTERHPDLLVLVDFPDFNLKLAETAKSLGIPVLFYVSPQVWAWRPKRIHRIGQLVTHMAVLFPFEVSYYERENIPVTYTGNPLVDDIDCTLTQEQAKEYLGLSQSGKTVALLPGSRQGELQRHLPVMLAAAEQLCKAYPDIQFVLPRANSLSIDSIMAIVDAHACKPVLVDGQAQQAMRSADVVVCASGTATLETALIGTPMVLVYRMNKLNYEIMRRLIKIPDIGLVNIVAEKRIVPELIQNDVSAEGIVDSVRSLLDNPTLYQEQVQELESVKKKLGEGGASGRVADLMMTLLATDSVQKMSSSE